MLRAAVYARISLDRLDGEGVARQLADCKALASKRGWFDPVEYVDNDISAYRRARRPAWDQLIADLHAGSIDVVVAYHPDRLYRRLLDLEDLIDGIEAAGAQVATVRAGDVDLSTATGRMQARIIAAVGRHESERIGERVSRAKQERAAQGRPAGGGLRPFGLTSERDALVFEEADELRRIAAAVVAGGSITAEVRRLDEAGIRTPTGRAWTAGTLRRVLTSPHVAGLRSYKGEIVGEASWPAIIDRDTWVQLCVITSSRRRGRPPADTHLLTGLVICEACERPMYGASVGAASARAYRCHAGQTTSGKGCGRSIAAEQLEQLVTDAVLAWLVDPDLVASFAAQAEGRAEPSAVADELERLERKRSTIAARWAMGEVSDGEYDAARQVLTARIDELNAGRRPRPRLRAAGADLVQLAAAWPELSIAERRAVITEVVDPPVNIGPGRDLSGSPVDPGSRVRILPAWGVR